MILFDDADQLAKLDPIVAGQTLRLPDRAVGRSSSPLPDYETSQAQHERATAVHTPKEKTDKRFWRATLCALCVYVVISAALGIPFIVMRLRKSHHNRPPPWIPPDEDVSTLPKQNLAHSGLFSLDSTDCNSWNNSEDVSSHSLYTAIASHSFAPSGTLSVRSNISHEESNIIGNLTVAINPDHNVSSILFQVFLEASSPELRQRTFACFADEGSARGLSLYFPQTLDESSLSVHIVLLFPQSSASLSSFETYLPMFSQSFLDLSDVSFGRASIEGYKKDISCDFLQAPRIKVKNALAAINGSFNATENLTIDTVGGPISGHMILVQGEGRTGPTFFSLDTGNSDINANITFQVTSDFYGHKKFMGSVKNFGGPLNLDLWHESSTPPVSLDLYVQNNQAPSNVSVDANFVGMFDVQTKLASASVKETAQAPIVDSTGDLIYRNYVYDQTSPNRVKGWVGWGARKTGWDFMNSRIEIASSLSPVELTLGS